MQKIYKLILFLVIVQILTTILVPINCKAGMISPPTNTIADSINENILEEMENTQKSRKEKLDELEEIKYLDFKKLVNEGKIDTVYFEKTYDSITSSNFVFYYKTIDGLFYKTTNPQYDTFRKDLLEAGINVKLMSDLYDEPCFKDSEDEEEFKTTNYYTGDDIEITNGFLYASLFACAILLFAFIRQDKKKKVYIGGIKGEGGITRNKDGNTTGKTFNDIAGLREAKKDVISLVDFIKNGKNYEEMGAKLPKGVILYGPPGTGKTLMAKAIAGEAGVPFFFASGSEFIEMYVGLGAKRVRDLFKKARDNAPCIVFIDEIDAIAGKRKNQDNSEDRKTLNQLLTEMDGFKDTNNVLVVAATNRIEDLDEAILRPGRFTDKFCIPLPETLEDRLEVINIYTQNKKFAEDVDFNRLAKETIGCSPADIEAMINEAAIIAVQNQKLFIDNYCIEQAYNKKVLKGHVKEDNSKRKQEELELVAWHEAGHAVAGLLLGTEISKVTILSSTSGVGGATFTIPSKMGLKSVEDLRNEVIQLYAGRCAEYLLYKDWMKTTTGASNDIDRATGIIFNMVSTLGMTEKNGMVNLNTLRINNDLIADEVSSIAKELQDECLKLLQNNIELLESLVKLLLEKETVYDNDLKDLINNYKEKEINN